MPKLGEWKITQISLTCGQQNIYIFNIIFYLQATIIHIRGSAYEMDRQTKCHRYG